SYVSAGSLTTGGLRFYVRCQNCVTYEPLTFRYDGTFYQERLVDAVSPEVARPSSQPSSALPSLLQQVSLARSVRSLELVHRPVVLISATFGADKTTDRGERSLRRHGADARFRGLD